ncbi:MAG: transketolase family protein [Armatimonadota bacterium]|nr:transketolase family protein [Armatimonadota bacterium]
MQKVATRDAYGQALVRLGERDPRIVVLDADLSKSTKTAEFAKRFPDRFFNVGVAEQSLIGTAAGLALGGKIPFASSFAVFATGRAFEQIRNSVCYPRLNVKIAATHAGLTVGEDGASHQSVADVAVMRALPHMTVVVPADARETEQAVEAAAEYNGPVYLRLGRLALPALLPEDYRFQWGKAVTLREGGDVSLLANGVMLGAALEAAEELARRGVQARVLNVSTVKPLDREAVLAAARETGALVTAEEHSIIGGLGSAVAELVGEEYPVPLARVGSSDTCGDSGAPHELLRKYGLTADGIVRAAGEVLARKRRY